MDIQRQGIVTLIRSGLTGDKLVLPEGFDLEVVYPRLVSHQIHPLCYCGAVNCGVDKQLPVMRKLFQDYCCCLQYSEGQMKAVEEICAAFDAAQVDYMCLKGSRMKLLYHKPEMRLMGDADILIRMEQYERVCSIMLELGFAEGIESNHELLWKRQDLQLELHKRLIASYNKDYYRYFGDGWRLATVQNGTAYEMTSEDEYIYLFTHFAKHYRDGGVGCRHLVDFWVYRKVYFQMDEVYIERELEKLHLLEFERNIRRVLSVWFEGEQPDSKTELITDFIFESDSWGKEEDHVVSAGVKNASETGSVAKGRVMQILEWAFPSAEVLRKRYPVLQRHPRLLPVVWLVRLVTAVLFRQDNVRKGYRALVAATPEKIQTYQEALSYVGLDFNFKE